MLSDVQATASPCTAMITMDISVRMALSMIAASCTTATGIRNLRSSVVRATGCEACLTGAVCADCVFQILPSHSYAGFKALKKHKKKMIAKKVIYWSFVYVCD